MGLWPAPAVMRPARSAVRREPGVLDEGRPTESPIAEEHPHDRPFPRTTPAPTANHLGPTPGDRPGDRRPPLLGAVALVAGGAELRDIDRSEREDGYLTSDGTEVSTTGYALASDAIHLDALPEGWFFGDTRVQVVGADPDDTLFVGIARPDDAAAYLENIEHSTVTEIDTVTYDHHEGEPPTTAPDDTDIWVAQRLVPAPSRSRGRATAAGPSW